LSPCLSRVVLRRNGRGGAPAEPGSRPLAGPVQAAGSRSLRSDDAQLSPYLRRNRRVVPRRNRGHDTPPPRSGGGAVVARSPSGRDVFRTRIPVFPRFRGKEVGQDSLPSPPPPDARCRGGPQIEIVSKISGQVDTLYGEDLSEDDRSESHDRNTTRVGWI
ncbi:hypothetical protein TNCT_481401, partial [Trichonephila clavata]